jgi:hypothetical protein
MADVGGGVAVAAVAVAAATWVRAPSRSVSSIASVTVRWRERYCLVKALSVAVSPLRAEEK